MLRQTDREKELDFLEKMTDKEAYANALGDSDCQPLTAEQLSEFISIKDIPGSSIVEKLANAQKRGKKQIITACFDADVVGYYKAKGKGYQSIMNAALRACMEAELAAKARHT